jgi:hypothetical protein
MTGISAASITVWVGTVVEISLNLLDFFFRGGEDRLLFRFLVALGAKYGDVTMVSLRGLPGV